MDCNSCGYAELVRDRRMVHCPECGSPDIVFESDPLAEGRAISEVEAVVKAAESIAVPKAAPVVPSLRISRSSSPPPSKSISETEFGRKQEEEASLKKYVEIDKQIKQLLEIVGLILTIIGLVLLFSIFTLVGPGTWFLFILRDSNFWSFLISGSLLLSIGLLCVYMGNKYKPGKYTQEEVKIFLSKVSVGLFGHIFTLVGLSVINSSFSPMKSNFWPLLISGFIFLAIGLLCVYEGYKYQPGRYTKEDLGVFVGKVLLGILGIVMLIGGTSLAFIGFIGGGGVGILGLGVTLVIIGFIILVVITKGGICECICS